LPTHGYGRFRRFIVGSVTAKVLHDVSCPVFTGAHIQELAPFNPEPYKRVACAIDLREHSEAVLRWAWGFAQSWSADLIVIHTAPSLEVGSTYSEFFPPESREAILQAARQQMMRLMAKVGCQGEVRLEGADVIRFVCSAVEDSYADVLVIGRSPAGLLGRLRTHAYGLIREAPVPVISI
jgi:nucleotide-binding universal stress UspA family protein